VSVSASAPAARETFVMRCAALDGASIGRLLGRYGIEGVSIAAGQPIPGSYWGAPEAGITGNRLGFTPDTPVHSLLHELAHYVCMDSQRRERVDTDAGGDDDEECAVCYLEVLLAPLLPPFDTERCLADMDAWGYSFREGSASAWFAGDGRDARDWLIRRRLIGADGAPTWRLRMGSEP
jgi:hypothetical protein